MPIGKLYNFLHPLLYGYIDDEVIRLPVFLTVTKNEIK